MSSISKFIARIVQSPLVQRYINGPAFIGFVAACAFAVFFLTVNLVAHVDVNWDAWVAIGTLALAMTTVLAIAMPIRREERRRRERAIILATALRDELSRVMVTTREIRERILQGTRTPRFNWDGFALLISKLAVPITDGAFEQVFDLQQSTAQWVMGTRTNVHLLKAMVALYSSDYSRLREVLAPLLLLSVQLQQHVTPAFGNVMPLLNKAPVQIDNVYFPSDFEIAYAQWVDAGADPATEPAWPH